MKKIVLAVLLLSTMLFSLEWEKDLDSAIATAQQEKKILMVLVEGEHCRWCKKMKHRTLGDESVEKRLENYVVVKVRREDPMAMQKLPAVNGVPTIFFMTADKKNIETVIGYFDVIDFTSYLSDVERKIDLNKVNDN